MKTFGAAALSAVFCVTALAGGFDTANLDKTCKPCEDFYKFANGGWMEKNPVPAAYPAWGRFDELNQRNEEALHEILEAAAKAGPKADPLERMIGDFYASGMDTAKIEAAGLDPLRPELARVDEVKDVAGLRAEIARLHADGVSAAFEFGASQDAKDSTRTIADAGQGGLGLPDRDYYLKDEERYKTIRDEYVAHVARMFELAGDDAAKAAASAKTVMRIETDLAKASMTVVEQRDPNAIYHKMTLAEAGKLTPGFPWAEFLAAAGAPRVESMNVRQPDFFRELDRQLAATPIAEWRTYLRWALLQANAPYLPQRFVDESFRFNGTVLTGTKENLPLWKRRVRATDTYLGEALGQVYVKRAFTPDAKRRALAMVENLSAALRDDLTTLPWMSDATRKQALAKLAAFMRKIGYPDKWKQYDFAVDRGPFAANVMRARAFAVRDDLKKIGKPVDRAEWGMTPPTVNAYYNPTMNEIVFPAGILQPPFFDPAADDAINYGGIGAVIGHEMTHGFDDEGSQFDAEGNLKNWWTDKDLESFKARAKCVEDQFGAYTVEGDLHLNGKLVTGESIADLGGLTIAYAAFRKSLEGKPRPADIDGFTPEQRFFLGWAQVWAENQRPEFTRLLVDTDPHPISRFRVNGPLSNMPAFAEAFGCKQGDTMVRPEAARCQIW